MTKLKESLRTPRPVRTRKPSKGQQVGYLRVSSLDQNEVRQLEGLALDKTFTDKASGKDVKRPQLQGLRMKNACEDLAHVLVVPSGYFSSSAQAVL